MLAFGRTLIYVVEVEVEVEWLISSVNVLFAGSSSSRSRQWRHTGSCDANINNRKTVVLNVHCSFLSEIMSPLSWFIVRNCAYCIFPSAIIAFSSKIRSHRLGEIASNFSDWLLWLAWLDWKKTPGFWNLCSRQIISCSRSSPRLWTSLHVDSLARKRHSFTLMLPYVLNCKLHVYKTSVRPYNMTLQICV